MIAEAIAKALGGRRSGKGWMARCPAHHDRTASLSISVGDRVPILLKCFAGCPQDAVIGRLKEMGLWPCGISANSPKHVLAPFRAAAKHDDKERSLALAHGIWRRTIPVKDTPGQTYLESRGLNLPLSTDLGFHPRLLHSEGHVFPGLVALVRHGVTGAPMGIHRTYLARDGKSKAATEPQKMMLGPIVGGAVRLGQPSDELLIGEGIETSLSAMQATGKPVWAALSTSGLCALQLPPSVTRVVILADADEAGERAAQMTAHRWTKEGRAVWIARPSFGSDFNDMLRNDAATSLPNTPPKPERTDDND